MANHIADKARSAVAIMAKAPLPGEVKTRLCPPLSYGAAAQLYQCFLLDKIAQVNALQRATPVVSYSPADSRSIFEGFGAGPFYAHSSTWRRSGCPASSRPLSSCFAKAIPR